MELMKACKIVPGKWEAVLLSGPISFFIAEQISIESILGVRWLGVGSPEEPLLYLKLHVVNVGTASLGLSLNPHNSFCERNAVDGQESGVSQRLGRLHGRRAFTQNQGGCPVLYFDLDLFRLLQWHIASILSCVEVNPSCNYTFVL